MARADDKILTYKNYHGSREISLEDGVIHGRILYIRDVITYESPDVPGVKSAFEAAVDRYLDFCKEVGDVPEKPFSGSFNVRITSARHREAVILAETAGTSLNKWVEDAIGDKILSAKVRKAWSDISMADTATTKIATVANFKNQTELRIVGSARTLQ